MRTKTYTLSLLVLATAFLCSSAFPGNSRNDGRRGLVKSNLPHGESLQNKKPPANVPGPKLTAEEHIATFFPGLYAHEAKPKKRLIGREKGRNKDMASLEKKPTDRNDEQEGKPKSDEKERGAEEEKLNFDI